MVLHSSREQKLAENNMVFVSDDIFDDENPTRLKANPTLLAGFELPAV